MGSIFFFPWFCISEQFAAADFQLIQYQRGHAPFGQRTSQQRIADRILGCYRHRSFEARAGRSVQTATILNTGTGEVLRDRTQDEVDACHEIAELVQFAGLSDRRFFSLHYSNSDMYRIVGQRFAETLDGIAPRSRRRDGDSLGFWSFKEWKIFAPDHVVSVQNTPFDADLLRALWELRRKNGTLYDRCLEALAVFNRGNTDGDSVPEFVEAVLLLGSFEKLLGVRGGNEQRAAEAFSGEFHPSRTLLGPQITARSGRTLRHPGDEGRCVREIWFRDFFRVRGSVAHGSRTPGAPSLWDLRSHLLLASAAFPLLLKMILSRECLYRLSARDTMDRDCFEARACVSHFERKYGAGSRSIPWTEACFSGITRPARRRAHPAQ